MKKKNLKSLLLNKKSISNMQANGGRAPISGPSVFDQNGCMSEGGCTTGPDQTMTCPHYSCACDQK